MNVSCPECRSVFRLDPAKITSVSMRARCSVCGGLIPVGAAVNWGDDLPASPPPRAIARGATPAGVRPMLSRTKTPVAAPSGSTWPPAMPKSEPVVPRALPPVAPSPAPRTTEPTPKARTRTPPFSPKHSPAIHKEQAPPAVPHAASGAPATTAPTAPSFGAPLTPPSRSAIPEAPPPIPIPEPPSPPKPAPGPVAFPASGNVAAAFSTPSTPAPPPAIVQRKPINPFLANDPNQKARRLARALVSDMVAYHPSKRDEGLQGGTLKQLFRDEIKKSYEEYVEQVGREFAESTQHFQEALNDVLAGGRKIF